MNKQQERLNHDVDNLLQGEEVEMSPDTEYQQMIDLAEEMMRIDFSLDSQIREPLRQRLLQRRQMMLQAKTMETTLPRLSLTWVMAIVTLVIIGGLFLAFSPDGGDSSSGGAFGSGSQQRASDTPPPTGLPSPTIVPTPTMPFTATPVQPYALRPTVPPPSTGAMGLPYSQSVVVAAQNIPAGTELEASMLTIVQWPMEAVPLASFVSPEELVGTTTVAPIPRWAPIQQTHVLLADEGDETVVMVLPATLEFGERLVEVNVVVAVNPDDLPEEVSADEFSLNLSTEDARFFQWALEAEIPITIQFAQ